ncbi:hypothetical protein B0H14DRAFT_2992712 [Mycena olivaceomarginata]|nr:hypothetical protein B0H14DRAFT_2992712 [Mycena olivaceomarginata]
MLLTMPLIAQTLLIYSNVDACITFLKRTYPRLAESSLPISECSKLVAAICICAEQTFTEASAKEEGFPLAFSAALDLYLTSSLQEAVNREIATLSPQVDRMTKVIKLVEIIQSHPLRIHPLKI